MSCGLMCINCRVWSSFELRYRDHYSHAIFDIFMIMKMASLIQG